MSLLITGMLHAPAIAKAGSPELVELRWSWSALGTGESGFFARDLDLDGIAELLIADGGSQSGSGTVWYRTSPEDQMLQVSSSLPFDGAFVEVAPGLAGSHRIAVATASEVQILEVPGGALVASIPIASSPTMRLEFADLDGDAGAELVVCTLDDLLVFDPATGGARNQRWGLGCQDLEIGQLDSDPQHEILLAGTAFGSYVLDGVSLAIEWADPLAADDDFAGIVPGHLGEPPRVVLGSRADGAVRSVALDASGAGPWLAEAPYLVDLVVLQATPSRGPRVAWGSSRFDGSILIVTASTGALELTIPSPFDQVRRLTQGDLDGDGDLELAWTAAGGSGLDTIFVASAETPSLDFSVPVVHVRTSGFAAPLSDSLERTLVASATWYDYDDKSFGERLVSFDPRRGGMIGSEPITPADWSSFFVVSGPLAIDLDGDLQDELCLAFREYPSDGVLCWDPTLGTELWRAHLPEDYPALALIAAELDGSPPAELVLASGRNGPVVFAFEAESGWLKWRSPPIPNPGWFVTTVELLAGDFEGDSDPEIVFFAPNGGLFFLNGSTGDVSLSPVDQPATALAIGDLDFDSEVDLLAGFQNGDLALLDASSGQVETVLGNPVSPVDGLAIIDLTRDGIDDFLVTTDSRLVLVDGSSLELAWNGPFIAESLSRNGRVAVGDFDGDSVGDFVVANSRTVMVFEAADQHLFLDGFESGDTGQWTQTWP